MDNGNRNLTLDLIRGLSALLVCISHVRAAMFPDFSDLPATASVSIFSKTFYFWTGLGHEAVMVFFVLSGFFVGGSVLRSPQTYSVGNYLIARISRLMTPLIPALILTYFVDAWVGLIDADIISGGHYPILNSGPNETYSTSALTFLGNLAFLQFVYTPVFGSNTPLWSLAYEFWYYMLFPLLMVIIGVVPRGIIRRILAAILFGLITYFIATDMIEGFIIWLFGALIFAWNKRKNLASKPWMIVAALVIFVATLVESKRGFMGIQLPLSSDIVVGLGFSLLLITVINTKLHTRRWLRLDKFAFWISEISYTLYIVHFPIVILIYAYFYKEQQAAITPNQLLIFTAWIALLLVVATIMWFLFERNTHVVRRFLKNWFSIPNGKS